MVRRLAALCLCLVGASAVNAQTDIRAMVVGSRALELAESRQLTFRADGDVTYRAYVSPNGRWVAYGVGDDINDFRVCVVEASGGKSRALLDARPYAAVLAGKQRLESSTWIPSTSSFDRIAWSPDSKLIAVAATRLVPGEEEPSEEDYVLLMTPKGDVFRSLAVPQGWTHLPQALIWSPDGRKLAGEFLRDRSDAEGGGSPGGDTGEPTLPKRAVLVFDIQRAAVHVVYEARDEFLSELIGWSASNGSVLMITIGDQGYVLREASLDGRPARVVSTGWALSGEVSPDSVYTAQAVDDKLSVEAVKTGQVVRTVDVPGCRFRCWAPDSRMFFYSREEAALKDETGARQKTVNSLWLSSLEQHKLNHLCVALDFNLQPPSVSSDRRRIAYVGDDHRVYVAELEWRAPTPGEKLLAKLPLTQDDEKWLMKGNARLIAIALRMYSTCPGPEGQYPPEATVREALSAYLAPLAGSGGAGPVFVRPGTDQDIFQYYPPGSGEVEDPEHTVVGTLDAGYSWKVAIYADGHVEVVMK